MIKYHRVREMQADLGVTFSLWPGGAFSLYLLFGFGTEGSV